jgi:hypothetical protein
VFLFGFEFFESYVFSPYINTKECLGILECNLSSILESLHMFRILNKPPRSFMKRRYKTVQCKNGI